MQKWSVLIFTGALLLAHSTVQADSLLQSFAECKRLSSDKQRLACFDAIESPALEQSTTQHSVPSRAEHATAVRNAQSEGMNKPQVAARKRSKKAENTADFGLPPKVSEDDIDEIAATITTLGETARGKLVISLDDGSQWQQKDSQYIKLTKGMQVNIERGFLGAFFLSYDGVNRRIKVTRIR